MSIDGDDVGDDIAHLVGAGRERARQNVVGVGGDDQLARSAGPCAWRRSRRRCRRSCRSARRTTPRGAARRARRRRRSSTSTWADDARPVDRVDAGERTRSRKRMVVEHAPSRAPGSRRTCRSTAIRRARSPRSAVVIMRRCTSETRPCGKQDRRRRRALRAAEGLDRRPARIARCRADDRRPLPRAPRATWSISRASSCMATSLNASVGPWNSSSIQRSGRSAPAASPPGARSRHRPRSSWRAALARDGAAGEREDDSHGDIGKRHAGERGDRRRAPAPATTPARRGRRRGRAPRAARPRNPSLGASPLVEM